jgi:arylsulfatase A-like enzyme
MIGIRTLLCWPLVLTLTAVTAIADDRPNVVLIVTDNQSEKLLGAYGKADIHTPNIDSLAEDGMLFTRAYAASGVCSPTRATLMTGLMPSQHGVHNALPSQFDIKNWAAVEEFRSLPQTLAEAGYSTGLVGKYHLGNPMQAQMGFDYWVTFPTGHTTSFHGVDVIDNGRAYHLDDEHLTDYWTRKATEFIDRQSEEKPFFLFLSYNGPYNLPPLVIEPAKNRHADYYRENVPSYPQQPVHPSLIRLAIEYSNVEKLLEEEGQWWTTEEEYADKAALTAADSWPWQTIVALNNDTAMAHLASQMTMIDDGVGSVLRVLEHKGLADDTIVVFTSDQSSAFGQHGLWGNSSYAEPHPAFMENMRVPLIVRHPGVAIKASQSERVINQADIFPTLLDLVGMGGVTIADSPGRSFAPILQGQEPEWTDAGFFEYITVRAIATDKWKYVKRLFGDPPELYDLDADPNEHINLAADVQYADVLSALDAQLEAFFSRYSVEKYDTFRGGTGKGLLMYNDENEDFEAEFPDWVPPYIERLPRFTDL